MPNVLRQNPIAASGLCLLALLASACQVTPPDTAGAISRATGVEGAIVFRSGAEPLPAATEAGEEGAGTLSLDQTVRLALAHDERIQSALARVRIAEADAHQARLLPNPILSIDLRVPNEPGINTAFEATLTGDLIALLQKPGQIASADKRLRKSAQEAIVTALDVMSEAQQAYVAAQSIDARLDNATYRARLLDQLRGITHKRLDAGEVARLDVLVLDAQIAQASLDADDLRLERTTDRLALVRIIGQPRLSLEGRLSPWENPPALALADEDAWITAALRHRPELHARLWELQALGDDMAAAEFSPLVGGDIGVHTEHDPQWRTGPTLTIPLPLFDWGQATREKLQAQRIEARHEWAGQQQDIIQEVRLAYATYVQSSRSLATARDQLLPALQHTFDQAELSYKAGESDLGSTLLAESDLRSAQSRLVDLQERMMKARIKLQRAAGGAAIAGVLESPSSSRPAGPQHLTSPTSRPATGPGS